ncbi:expressed unknown protein [Seminavis robusta]|uniref:Uncharacterized protein n=1 Tax=Seminavis robusta TaxID=568900 RepID=A0A9N8E7M7_9STRA|nr:expressed unknown protein [Seminavis robusta]|eukprot:Sro631_g178430.1 n/a (223) ;mRNA; r:11307-11975
MNSQQFLAILSIVLALASGAVSEATTRMRGSGTKRIKGSHDNTQNLLSRTLHGREALLLSDVVPNEEEKGGEKDDNAGSEQDKGGKDGKAEEQDKGGDKGGDNGKGDNGKGQGREEEDNNINEENEEQNDEDVLTCFANTLAAAPETVIFSADIVTCATELISGLDGEIQLDALLNCLGTALDCANTDNGNNLGDRNDNGNDNNNLLDLIPLPLAVPVAGSP